MRLVDLFEAELSPSEQFEDAFDAQFKVMASYARVDLHQMSPTETEISYLHVNSDRRGQRIASRIMKFLTDLADHLDVTLYLSPATDADPEEGPDFDRLREWYESWGFVKLSGRDMMKREPSGDLTEAKSPRLPKRYVYHMTNSRNLLSIQRHGLQTPESGNHESNWGGNMGVNSANKVFFANSEEMAKYYGDIVRQGVDRDSIYHTYFAMLRVPADKIPGLVNDRDGQRIIDTDFYTHKNVPPRFIEMKWGDRDEYKPILSVDVSGIATGDWDDVKDDDYDEDQ